MHEAEVAIVVWDENGARVEDAAPVEALVEDGALVEYTALVVDGAPVKNPALHACGRVRGDFWPQLWSIVSATDSELFDSRAVSSKIGGPPLNLAREARCGHMMSNSLNVSIADSDFHICFRALEGTPRIGLFRLARRPPVHLCVLHPSRS